MSVSRRDYAIIADLIAEEVGTAADSNDVSAVLALAELARKMSYAFVKENARFDPARFLAACGFDSNGVGDIDAVRQRYSE